MKYDVIIIGAGLGGLQCGYILAKKGLNICVLEKEHVLGGCLQSFKRAGNEFDTGFHYVGGLSEGQPLNVLFSYFGLMDLPWHQLDNDAFDEVVIGGKSYFFANGYEQFAERLTEYFPSQRENLRTYTNFLQKVGNGIADSFKPKGDALFSQSLFARSAYEYLNETITDPLLRNVLSGTSLKMELNASTLPLYIFAQINSSFIQSAWRLQGSGSQIADKLAANIEQLGGTIRSNATVTQLIETEGRISAVEVNGEELIEADTIISDIHPASTLNLLKDSKLVRNIYRKRISNLENTFGMFTANISLKPNAIKYLNRNQFVYSTSNLWNVATDGKTQSVLISYRVPQNGASATNIDILTPMQWSEVEKWADTQVGRRGNDYLLFKQSKADECIKLASSILPNLPDAVDKVYTSTPLTYRDYTATAQGSAYGIRKNYGNLLYTLLTPRTPVPNLLLTGQNLNLHGVLGVTMSSFFTCAEVVGMEAAISELKFE